MSLSDADRIQLQREAFVIPTSPSKRNFQQLPITPESPDMKHARHRLGNLLSVIRKGEIVNEITPREEQAYFLFT